MLFDLAGSLTISLGDGQETERMGPEGGDEHGKMAGQPLGGFMDCHGIMGGKDDKSILRGDRRAHIDAGIGGFASASRGAMWGCPGKKRLIMALPMAPLASTRRTMGRSIPPDADSE